MIIGVPKEILDNENRVAAIPATVKDYKKGHRGFAETNAGEGSFISDNDLNQQEQQLLMM